MADETVRVRDQAVEVTHAEPEPYRSSGVSARVPRVFPAKPARHGTLLDSWWTFAATACAVIALLGLAIWLSAHVRPDPALHDIALFVHLSALVLGFGAVLVADYFLALWVLRRATFAEAVRGAARLHPLVWAGLSGLVLSGVLLEPDLTAGMTRLKLAFVFVLTLNGLQAMLLSKRVEASAGALGMRLLVWGAVTTAVSQACWWGAVWIGFWTAIHRV